MPNKMTDNKIIKALKEILEIMCAMGDLQKTSTISNAIDLINRQKAEIESAKETIKAEAVKEFAERLAKDYAFEIQNGDGYWEKVVRLDNILKEMVGENDAEN